MSTGLAGRSSRVADAMMILTYACNDAVATLCRSLAQEMGQEFLTLARLDELGTAVAKGESALLVCDLPTLRAEAVSPMSLLTRNLRGEQTTVVFLRAEPSDLAAFPNNLTPARLEWVAANEPPAFLQVRLAAALARLTEREQLRRERGQTATRSPVASLQAIQLRVLLDTCSDACLIADAAGRLLDVSRKALELFGYTREEALHLPLAAFLADTETLDAMQEAVAAKGRFVGECLGRCKDGRRVATFVTAAPVGGEDRSADSGLLCVLRDVDSRATIDHELSLAKERAELANRLKNEYLASMAHEMRTPIGAVIGYAEVLEEALGGRHDLLDHLDHVRRNCDHLLRLINDILDLAKVESGKLVVESIACSPFTIMGDCYNLLKGKARDRGVELRLEYTARIPQSIRSDPTRVLQCLVNLADNAVKFTPAGGSVTVTMRMVPRDPQPLLEVRVHDTGIGIPPEKLDRIFRPFEQAEAGTTRKFGGTGLGLSITKRLAELLGGGLAVESREGQGSTFTLSVSCGLPAPELTLVSPPTLHEIQEESRKLRKLREQSPQTVPASLKGLILLAEDFPDTQKLISYMLRKGGAEVDLASTGREALEMGLKKQYDVILMDMLMPEMDGITVVQCLREQNYRKPIIALTAATSKDVRRKFLAAGCDDVATKPIERQTLLRLVGAWLNFSADASEEERLALRQRLYPDMGGDGAAETSAPAASVPVSATASPPAAPHPLPRPAAVPHPATRPAAQPRPKP